MNYSRRNTQFKPYTGRDYEQFKKNFGFGTGYLAHDFESTTHKEKVTQFFCYTRKSIQFFLFSRLKHWLKLANMLNKSKLEIRKNSPNHLVVLYPIHDYQKLHG